MLLLNASNGSTTKDFKEIKFGEGGGFTGAVTEYQIKAKGDLLHTKCECWHYLNIFYSNDTIVYKGELKKIINDTLFIESDKIIMDRHPGLAASHKTQNPSS